MANPIAILKKYWGYSSFRPLQEDIIQSVLDGKDTLALLPTGGGKSICFQVPALCQEGVCIVISPLIALMKDQVGQLRKRGISAAALYAGMRKTAIDYTLDNAVNGGLKLLYLSPERLLTEIVRVRIQKMQVNLIAVDEAHCISQWGYDFRPAYLQIAGLRELVPDIPVIALTATATPQVVGDIQEKLAFKQQHLLQKSFSRPNLSYSVLKEEEKLEKLHHILSRVKGTSVVYVRNRRKTKEIALFLSRRGHAVSYYHAGLGNELRSKRQEAWMENKIRVMISTNAFGMGIDKADVRSVIHLDLPESLEAYFQEAGRAGRDGKKAYAVLLFNESDKARLHQQYEKSFPEMTFIRSVYQALGSYLQLATGSGEGQSFEFQLGNFAELYKFNAASVFQALKLLEQAEWLALSEAIFVPSSLQVIVGKDNLYDFQLRNPNFDPIIKTILRTYQGVFQQPVYVNEGRLAHFLKITPDQLRQRLISLQQQEIIEYLPQTESPRITFLKPRIPAQDLTIDQQLYKFRKEQYAFRMNNAIAYAERVICRSQQLLAYFGEKKIDLCGICDVCLGRTKKEGDLLEEETFEKLRLKIKRLLKREGLTLREIVDSFSSKWETPVLKTIEYLLDEGILKKEEEVFYWDKE